MVTCFSLSNVYEPRAQGVECYDLNENGSDLNTWSPIGRTVWKGLKGVTL